MGPRVALVRFREGRIYDPGNQEPLSKFHGTALPVLHLVHMNYLHWVESR